MQKAVSSYGSGRLPLAAFTQLYEARVEKQMTQKEAAQVCGVKQQTWSGWERAECRPPRRYWEAIGMFLGGGLPEARTEIGKVFPRDE